MDTLKFDPEDDVETPKPQKKLWEEEPLPDNKGEAAAQAERLRKRRQQDMDEALQELDMAKRGIPGKERGASLLSLEPLSEAEREEMREELIASCQYTAEDWYRELRDSSVSLVYETYDCKWLNMYQAPSLRNPNYQNHWYRHPCGDFPAPWEQDDYQLFEARKERERRHLYNCSMQLLMPESKKLQRILGSDASLEAKFKAVRVWEAKHLHECQPDFNEHPVRTIKYGWLYHDLPSAIYLKRTPEWIHGYAEPMKQQNSNRKREEQADQKWLLRHAPEILKRNADPALVWKATQRMQNLGWSKAELRRRTKKK